MKRACLLLVVVGCNDALDQRLDVIDQPRVLAVIAEPPEAKPGAMVAYAAVLAAPDPTTVAGTVPAWAYCIAPEPPTEDDVVAPACVGNAPSAIVPLGTAATVTATLPAMGCALFGPDTPPGNFRPRDADSTGGYYQPVRATADGITAFGLSRITCNLPTAPTAVAHAYQLGYVANANPSLDQVALADASGAAIDPTAVPAEATVTLTASWSASAVESYLFYDTGSQTLITRREAMHVSWYTTAGEIAVDGSAVAETDPATSVATTWRTPTAAGAVTLWVVLRDSRGGTAVATMPVTIR